jgi:hypothetical protein
MKFLVIRLSSMGDVILTTPFLRALRRRFPEAEVHFLTKPLYAGLVALHPAVDRVIPFDESASLWENGRRLRGERYDAVFDLHKNLRSIPLSRMAEPDEIFRIEKATLRRWLLIAFKLDFLKERGDQPAVCIEVGAELGLSDDGGPPDVHPPRESLLLADAALADLTPPLWGLVPVASSWNKRWPHFAELGRSAIRSRRISAPGRYLSPTGGSWWIRPQSSGAAPSPWATTPGSPTWRRPWGRPPWPSSVRRPASSATIPGVSGLKSWSGRWTAGPVRRTASSGAPAAGTWPASPRSPSERFSAPAPSSPARNERSSDSWRRASPSTTTGSI